MSEPLAGHVGCTPPKIGWFTASCVLISNIVGGGIFTVTGFMARDLGDPILILSMWVLGGSLAMAAAMSYSELPVTFPKAGGDYIYLREAYGPLLGFLSGWTSFTVGFGAGIAAASVSFASYVLRLIPIAEENSATAKSLAVALVWGMTIIHCAGSVAGGRLQRALTITKLLAISLFIAGGISIGNGNWAHLVEQRAHAAPGIGALVSSLIVVMYTYLGWNVIGYIAGEVANPQRTIPIIVIAGTAFVAGLYLLINLVYLYALPVTELAASPVLPVAEKSAAALFGSSGARLVAALLCIALAGGVSAMIWAGPHVYRAMALDGVFPPFFSTVSPKTGVPMRAMFLQGIWASLLILTGTYEQVLIFSGFVLSAFTALTIGSVLLLRRRQPHVAGTYRTPLYPGLPILVIGALLIIVGAAAITRPMESTLALVLVLSGVPLYWLCRTTER